MVKRPLTPMNGQEVGVKNTPYSLSAVGRGIERTKKLLKRKDYPGGGAASFPVNSLETSKKFL